PPAIFEGVLRLRRCARQQKRGNRQEFFHDKSPEQGGPGSEVLSFGNITQRDLDHFQIISRKPAALVQTIAGQSNLVPEKRSISQECRGLRGIPRCVASTATKARCYPCGTGRRRLRARPCHSADSQTACARHFRDRR